ncbi:MAG: type II CAAX prenyl endopeptidase Rce1 family protein [Candidatus Methanofastidiosia archaeon]
MFKCKLSLSQIALIFSVSFTYFFLMSGFSKEFLFRAFMQTRFSMILKSKIGGVLLGSLLYGLLHIPNIMQLYPLTTVAEAFCRVFFVRTFMGIIFGVLWERTRSLIPCIFEYSGVNDLNNLGWIISKLGL